MFCELQTKIINVPFIERTPITMENYRFYELSYKIENKHVLFRCKLANKIVVNM